MRIPSGDLAPARRRRRHVPRRGRGRALPLLLAVLLLGGLAGGAVLLRRGDSRPEPVAGGCPTALRPVALTQAALPPPGQVRLVLLNGTSRDGLGRTVAGALAARGFGVLSTGNAPGPLAGPSRVVFGPGARPGATLVAGHVLGARLVPAPTAPRGSVQVVLGSAFVRLRTPQEVPVALRALTAPPPAPARPAPARPAPAGPAPAPSPATAPC